MSNSSTSRYETENRRYQGTAQTMTSGSKCRHLNSAGRGLIMGYTAAYQTRSLTRSLRFCNTALFVSRERTRCGQGFANGLIETAASVLVGQ